MATRHGYHDRHPRSLKDRYHATQDLRVDEQAHDDGDKEGQIHNKVLQREVQVCIISDDPRGD